MKFKKIYPRNVVRYRSGTWWYYRQYDPRGDLFLINGDDTLPKAWDAANRSAHATVEAMSKPGLKRTLRKRSRS